MSISSPGDPLRPARPVDVLVDVHLQERYAIRYICVQMILLFRTAVFYILSYHLRIPRLPFPFIQEFLGHQMQIAIWNTHPIFTTADSTKVSDPSSPSCNWLQLIKDAPPLQIKGCSTIKDNHKTPINVSINGKYAGCMYSKSEHLEQNGKQLCLHFGLSASGSSNCWPWAWSYDWLFWHYYNHSRQCRHHYPNDITVKITSKGR